jgi:PEP-CTERM motif
MKRLQCTLLVLAVVCIISIPAAADSIFNDFNTGNSYNCCTGWTVAGANSGVGQYISANEFTAAASAQVTEIDLAISKVLGDGAGTAALYTVGGNGLPGTLLGSWSFVAHQAFGQCCAVEQIANIQGGPMLAQATQYYMVLSADSATYDVWNFNTVGAMGRDLFSQDNMQSWHDNGTQTLGTFSIEGTSVPEPGTLLMLGSGVVAVAGAFRRKLGI